MIRSMVLVTCITLVFAGCSQGPQTPRADMGLADVESSQLGGAVTSIPKDANAILEITAVRSGTVTIADGRVLPYFYFKGIAIEPVSGGSTGAVKVFDAVAGGLGSHGFNIADLSGDPPDIFPSVAWAHHTDSGDVFDLRGGFLHIEFLGPATASTDDPSSEPVLPVALDPLRFPGLVMDPAPTAEVQWSGRVRITAPWVPWTITRGKRLATGAVSTSYIHVVVPGANSSLPPRLERLYGKSDKWIVGKHTDRNPVHENVLSDKFSDWIEATGAVTTPAHKDQAKDRFVSQVRDFVALVRAAP